jgi:hypothetical protein
MTLDYSAIYGNIRRRILAQNFAIGRYFRNNYMANGSTYGLANLDLISTRNRVLRLNSLKCLKGGGDCELHVKVEGTLRPTLKRHSEVSNNQECYLNIDYKMSNLSSATFELQVKQEGDDFFEVVASVNLFVDNLTAADVSCVLDNGDSKYELHYRVFALFPAEVGLLQGGSGPDDTVGPGSWDPLNQNNTLIQAGPNDDWHVATHQRENPLIASGVLLTCLAVEYYLGNQEALKLIRSALVSIGSLYKFNGNHFDGYIIRWDAVTSDFWQEEFSGGAVQSKRCLNFLTDANGKYLYCTPFDSPDYVTPENFEGVPGERWSYLVRYRHWEPSMDEINGLMMGYDAVYRFVDDQGIRDAVRAQADNLGDYLAEHAYLLVRPAGGFTERGSAGPNSAMEYPFGEAFRRITGNPYPIRTNWEGAAIKSGVWNQIQSSVNFLEGGYLAAAVTGGGIVLAVTPFLAPVLGLIGLALTELTLIAQITPFSLARAAAIYQNRDYFDVKHTNQPEGQGERDSFALAYLLLQVFPRNRTELYLSGIKKGIGGCGKTFPRYWGINALQLANRSDNCDPNLSLLYLDWNEAFYQNWLTCKDAKDQNGNPDGGKRGWWDANRTGVMLDSAMGVLHDGGPLYMGRLIGMLNDSTQYTPPDAGGTVGDHDLNYMCAIALAWLYAKLQQEKGVNISFPDFPGLPDPSTWPAPSIPILPDTYVILGDTVNQPLSAYQDKKGRSIDFGAVSNGVGYATILIAYPQDFCPRPLDALQPNCNHDQLTLDSNQQALVFFGDPTVQKPSDPVIHQPQPLQYSCYNPVGITGNFNPANLQVDIPTNTNQFAYNQPAMIGLTFSPERSGSFTGSLTIVTDNPYLSSITFTLSAQVIGPQVEATPLDFGEVILGASQTQTVIVKNTGPSLLYGFLQDEPLDQSPVNQFALQCVLPHYYQIQPGQSIGIPVEYTARAAGPARARLEFAYYDAGPARPKLEIALQAMGVGPALGESPAVLDFGVNNSVKKEQHRMIELTGKTLSPVTVSQLKLEVLDNPAFYIFQDPQLIYIPQQGTLHQNDLIDVDILFYPTKPGETYHAKLHIFSDDLLLPEQEVLISGGASGALGIILAPDSLDFGTVLLSSLKLEERPGKKQPLPDSMVRIPGEIPGRVNPVRTPTEPKLPHIPVGIKSYGTSDLVLSQISFDPPCDAFSLSGLPAASPILLAPGTRLDFYVIFNPSRKGTYQSKLKIISNESYRPTYLNNVIGVCKS